MFTSEDSQWLCRELGYVLSAAAEEFNGKQLPLRDQFAIIAMQGLLAADSEYAVTPERVAFLAYEQADAMLKAREPKAEVG